MAANLHVKVARGAASLIHYVSWLCAGVRRSLRGCTTSLEQVVREATDAAHNYLNLDFLSQSVEVLMNGVSDNVSKICNVICGRVVDCKDSSGEAVVVPASLYCLRKFGDCEIAEPVDLVLDRDGEDFGMLKHGVWGDDR